MQSGVKRYKPSFFFRLSDPAHGFLPEVPGNGETISKIHLYVDGPSSAVAWTYKLSLVDMSDASSVDITGTISVAANSFGTVGTPLAITPTKIPVGKALAVVVLDPQDAASMNWRIF